MAGFRLLDLQDYVPGTALTGVLDVMWTAISSKSFGYRDDIDNELRDIYM